MNGVGGSLAIKKGQASAVELGTEDEANGKQDSGRAGKIQSSKHLRVPVKKLDERPNAKSRLCTELTCSSKFFTAQSHENSYPTWRSKRGGGLTKGSSGSIAIMTILIET